MQRCQNHRDIHNEKSIRLYTQNYYKTKTSKYTLSHTSKNAQPHAVQGFVSFGNGLLSGGGGSIELLSAKILLLCAEVFSVLFLAAYRLRKAHHYTGKNKQVYRKTFASWQFSALVQSAF